MAYFFFFFLTHPQVLSLEDNLSGTNTVQAVRESADDRGPAGIGSRSKDTPTSYTTARQYPGVSQTPEMTLEEEEEEEANLSAHGCVCVMCVRGCCVWVCVCV